MGASSDIHSHDHRSILRQCYSVLKINDNAYTEKIENLEKELKEQKDLQINIKSLILLLEKSGIENDT